MPHFWGIPTMYYPTPVKTPHAGDTGAVSPHLGALLTNSSLEPPD